MEKIRLQLIQGITNNLALLSVNFEKIIKLNTSWPLVIAWVRLTKWITWFDARGSYLQIAGNCDNFKEPPKEL